MKQVATALVIAAALATAPNPPVVGRGATVRQAAPGAAFDLGQRGNDPACYFGFDRNDYPGDDQLTLLKKTFSYTGYWLSNPPGSKTNTWVGKRKVLVDSGFGFLVIFNGKTYAQLRGGNPGGLGTSDARVAAEAARREGFPKETVIFLDQEEGGRLLAEQRAYLHAWIDEVHKTGFRAGVYCSGVPFKEGGGQTVVTAEDIQKNAGSRDIVYWVSNDSCGPSPGCVFPRQAPAPKASGVAFAVVWQFAQSPRRPALTASCASTYNPDGNCYPPGSGTRLHVDLNSATSPDPSRGRPR